MVTRRIGGLRDKLSRSNLTEVSFMIVNEREALSRAMYWELKRRAPPGVPVYQQAPFQNDVWDALDGDKDDFLVYDRTDHWLLVYSPVPISCIFLCYLIIIWAGPKLMAKREPVNLKPVLIVYNFAMVCLSAYMFYEFTASSWLARYSLLCQPVDYSNSPLAMRMFFILRKKNSQLTFLHVYHHATMIFNWWAGVKYLQFLVVTIHTTYNLFADCDFPDSMNMVVLAYSLSLIALFANFYYHSYLSEKKTKKT
ncbi:hypothetical protein PAMA_005469 [Pampus argenteus]